MYRWETFSSVDRSSKSIKSIKEDTTKQSRILISEKFCIPARPKISRTIDLLSLKIRLNGNKAGTLKLVIIIIEAYDRLAIKHAAKDERRRFKQRHGSFTWGTRMSSRCSRRVMLSTLRLLSIFWNFFFFIFFRFMLVCRRYG